MTCPHCGRPLYGGAVMCEWCAEAISTNQLFEQFTFGGRLDDHGVAVMFSAIIAGGVVVLLGLIAMLLASLP